MLTTLDGQRAFEAGRLEQIAIARAVQRQTAILWGLMRYADLDASADAWAIAQLQAVLAGRQASSASARRWYNRLRLAEVGEALPAAPPPPATPAATATAAARGSLLLQAAPDVIQQVATSLRVTGPVRVKQAIAAGADPATAMRTGATSATRATQRLVLDGGRDTTLDLMQSDPLVTYYERVAASTACDFCKMLAGRGAVYTLESGSFRSHDGCGCSIRAVFRSEPRRRVNIGPPGHRNAVKATVYPGRTGLADLPPAPAWDDPDLVRRALDGLGRTGDDVAALLTDNHVFTDGTDMVRFPKLVRRAERQYAGEIDYYEKSIARWEEHVADYRGRIEARLAELRDVYRVSARDLANFRRNYKVRGTKDSPIDSYHRRIQDYEGQIAEARALIAGFREKITSKAYGRLTDDITDADEALAKRLLSDLGEVRPRLPKWRREDSTGRVRPYELVVDAEECESINAIAFTYVGGDAVWFHPKDVMDTSTYNGGFFMRARGAQSRNQQTMAHELGHTTDTRENRQAKDLLFQQWRKSPHVSGYANENAEEMYAEMFTEWMFGDRDNPAVRAWAYAFRWEADVDNYWIKRSSTGKELAPA